MENYEGLYRVDDVIANENMQNWSLRYKQLVTSVLARRAGGM